MHEEEALLEPVTKRHLAQLEAMRTKQAASKVRARGGSGGGAWHGGGASADGARAEFLDPAARWLSALCAPLAMPSRRATIAAARA